MYKWSADRFNKYPLSGDDINENYAPQLEAGHPEGAVSWCFGHLAEYAMPEAYDERYRKWSLEALPIIPDKWKLEVAGDKAKQFKILRDLLNSREFSYVVNACDSQHPEVRDCFLFLFARSDHAGYRRLGPDRGTDG